MSSVLSSQYKLLGKFSEAGDVVKNTGVKTVMVTAPGLSKEKLAKLISDVQPYARNISFVPDLIRNTNGRS